MSSASSKHPMRVATRRTGLRPDVIRAWERRYRAVRPARSESNRRLYSDDDIKRLLLLRRALDAGWQIGHVAAMSDAELEALLEEAARSEAAAPRRADDSVRRRLCTTLDAIEGLDGEGLRRHLEEAAVDLGCIRLLDEFLAPLMQEVGERCGDGRLRTVHEHLATAVVRRFVGGLDGAYPTGDIAPAIVVTTPAYQFHELGAMLVAATARIEGWRTNYLGPNLPAEEIVAAAKVGHATAVALSVTFPGNDSKLTAELKKMGRLMPEDVELLVGGRAVKAYGALLDEIGAIRLTDLVQLRRFLHSKRSGKHLPQPRKN